MKNGISVCALSEYANEVRESPEEAEIAYGVSVNWESGARTRVEPTPMRVGPHRVARAFSWHVDEPRQLLGSNHAPNPQEYLLSGLGACLAMAFVAGATARGIQLETLRVEVSGDLDLHGFLGLGSNKPTGFKELSYRFFVTGDASASEFEELQHLAERHSPNAQTLLAGVKLNGGVCASARDNLK